MNTFSEKICYKLCRLNNGKYESLIDHMPLLYEFNKITYPKIGKIFVFDNLKNIVQYYYSKTNVVILEGIGVNPIKPKYIFENGVYYRDLIWKTKAQHKTPILIDKNNEDLLCKVKPIPGTLYVDNFMPIKRINLDELFNLKDAFVELTYNNEVKAGTRFKLIISASNEFLDDFEAALTNKDNKFAVKLIRSK